MDGEGRQIGKRKEEEEWEGQEGERDKYNLKYTYENVIINHYHVTYIYTNEKPQVHLVL